MKIKWWEYWKSHEMADFWYKKWEESHHELHDCETELTKAKDDLLKSVNFTWKLIHDKADLEKELQELKKSNEALHKDVEHYNHLLTPKRDLPSKRDRKI